MEQGWYPDQNDSSLLRWWDGSAWTQHTQLAAAPRMVADAPLPSIPVANNKAIGIALAVLSMGAVVALIMYLSPKKNADDTNALNDETKANAVATAKDTEADREQRAAKARYERSEALRVQSKGMSRSERDAWLRQCVTKPSCDQWDSDAVVNGAPLEDMSHAYRVASAAFAENIAKVGVDGTTMTTTPVGVIGGILQRENVGMAMFDEMKKTSVAEAKKDPSAARGRVLKASGNVIEITKVKDFYEGTLVTGDGSFVHFVTTLSTDGIYDNSWATFSGVFVQQFAYPNVSGGQTKTVLVVGGFNIPANR